MSEDLEGGRSCLWSDLSRGSERISLPTWRGRWQHDALRAALNMHPQRKTTTGSRCSSCARMWDSNVAFQRLQSALSSKSRPNHL